MSDDAISVKISADVGGLVDGMKEAAGATEEATEQIKGDVEGLGHAAEEAVEPVESLTEKLREFASEQRSEGRLAGFMAGQIAQLGISSKSAAGEITGFISAFAFGGGLGVGIEALKVAIEKFTELSREENVAAEATAKIGTDGVAEIKAFTNQLTAAKEAAGLMGTALKAAGLLSPHVREEEEAQKALKEAIAKVAEERKKGDAAAAAAGAGVHRDEKHIGELDRPEAADNGATLAALKEEEDARAKLVAIQKVMAGIAAAAAPDIAAEKAAAAAEHQRQVEEKLLEFKDQQEAKSAALRAGYAQAAIDASNLLAEIEKSNADALFAAEHPRIAEAAEAAKQADKIEEENQQRRVERQQRISAFEDGERKKATEELKKQAEEEIAAAKKVAGQFTGAITGMIDGTKSFKQSMKEMADAAIKDAIRMTTEFIAQQVLKATGSLAAQQAGDAAAKAANVASVTSDAAVAGAGAAASMASIPFVGPELAAAAMVATSSSVLGAMGPMASAEGGFDIGNFNPLTQLHAREMVLPARYADMIRGMAARSSGPGGGGDIHVHTQDAHGLARVLKNNQGALIKTAQRIQSNRRTR